MTASPKTVAVSSTHRVSCPAVPKAEKNLVAIRGREDRCPLCFAPDPVVILAGTVRSLAECSNCSVVFQQPRTSQSELSRLFSEEYISTVEDVDIRFGARPEKSHSQVARFIHGRKASGRILDLGCAGGHFLDRFFPTSAWEKWGVDLSKFAAVRAMTKSIRVHVGDIHSAALPSASFDVVTVLDTFYYFPEPSRELHAIHRILKPHGLLVIALPYAGAHIWRNTGWRSKLFAWSRRSLLESAHLFFYNPRSMTSVLRGSGFEVTDQRTLPSLDQGSLLRNLVASGYYAMSAAAWHLSGARLMLGPRFLVAATATTAARHD